ncbi:glutathione S-transferase [Mycena albidolilacea]|uniref:glutathione transferase n=1 Tax=Mycena albidolilacea TaxID=1033008 RepID=A0AAD6Z0Q1_9AGAR|nr:glutathione S-transferase [Mycena albidolilacea]
MAILKLYGASHATCTRRVATVLHELKVPFELVEVDVMNGEHKTAAYMQKQPFGQIPYIDDDGFILYESRAICRYIAAKHPESGLIPTDPKANALFERAASVELSNWDPSASKAGLELMKKGFGMPCDQAVVDAQLEILDKKLEGYEAILSEQRYVAGDSFTLADLFHIPYAPLVASGGSDIMTRKPNVARWYNELVARPSWLAYQDRGVKTTAAY